jgi:hypothetical protein
MNKWMSVAAEKFYLNLNLQENVFIEVKSDRLDGCVIFVRNSIDVEVAKINNPDATICCIENKLYFKKYSSIEKTLLKFLAGNKARFYS